MKVEIYEYLYKYLKEAAFGVSLRGPSTREEELLVLVVNQIEKDLLEKAENEKGGQS